MGTRLSFYDLLAAQQAAGKRACVGLDLDLDHAKFPPHMKHEMSPDNLLDFGRAIVSATADLAGAFKPNSAFFEQWGDAGFRVLRELIRHIHAVAPEVPVIYDGKRGDIGDTCLKYTKAAFDYLDADAITVPPYMGAESLLPFLERPDRKGVIVLCRTSNKGAAEFQGLTVRFQESPTAAFSSEEPLYLHVARQVSGSWNANGNCGLVVGATAPAELGRVREIAPDLPILIPGVGKQGGSLADSVKAAKRNFVINLGSSTTYASAGADFAEATRRSVVEASQGITAALAAV